MLAGVILLWFIEVVLAVVFVAWDIRRTPEAAVMKWGFVVAYPINWWLVANGLKHGMKTVIPDGTAPPLTAGLALAGATLVRVTLPGPNDEAVEDISMDAPNGSDKPATDPSHAMAGHAMRPGNHPQSSSSRLELVTMAGASFALLAAGIVVAGLAGSLLGT